ncbi:NAD(P)H-dependent flavin oxidoreductase [Variovorax sp. PBL-E5]|uniref:NAD(P)H-dependent flavin oxidoreductase n=1 Tax=Variovorax sp. PBL-E5 TaxID=434014 RepID=UPI0013177339|nr:nitronate monooxygenase family protein [Variovorax sp. PBL-E5]VTU46134.1 Nitronate monooxygenase [Variovorax sp. PBL-E5]
MLATRATALFGIAAPIFAFSHAREVVAAVSRAGGMGIYGASTFSPERVDADLAWIAHHVDGKPFGVDVMIPLKSDGKGTGTDVRTLEAALEQSIPQDHRDFTESLLQRFGVPLLAEAPPRPDDGRPGGPGWRSSWYEFRLGAVESGALMHVEIALRHPIALLVTALGPPPPDVRARARERGIRLGALVGSPRHAQQQVDAGVDLIIAQGTEAAAHTGDISTLVLVPEIVEAVAPVPVLAAGGIGSGAQLAAALALGAEGAWTGSIWLACAESDEPAAVVERLLAARSTDTLRSRCRTGKPLRQLRSEWSAAWEAPDAPPMLGMPSQHLLTAQAEERIQRHGRADLTTIPVGQVVGRMNRVQSAAQIVSSMVEDCESTLVRIRRISSNSNQETP